MLSIKMRALTNIYEFNCLIASPSDAIECSDDAIGPVYIK